MVGLMRYLDGVMPMEMGRKMIQWTTTSMQSFIRFKHQVHLGTLQRESISKQVSMTVRILTSGNISKHWSCPPNLTDDEFRKLRKKAHQYLVRNEYLYKR